MKRLLIAGAGGFGREALAWALACPSNRTEWRVGGFLDANPSALEGFDIDFPLVGAPESYEPREDDVFICAIGDPATKLRVALDLKSRGARFVNVIHPTAIIGPNSRMGTGCILCPNCMVTTNVVLGDFVTLNLAATVGHDARIGDGSILSPHADVTGCCTIGRGVFMGSHACVIPGTVVEDFVTIGAGSVVIRTAPANSTVVGVPARPVARR